MATQLPHNDPDLLLAREVGAALRAGFLSESIDDPLIRELLAYRRQRRQPVTSEQARSDELWERIERATSDNNAVSAIPLFRSPAMRWAAAAAVLVAALVGFVYFQYMRGPTLVAESGAAITTVQLADGSDVTLRPHSTFYRVSNTDSRSIYQLDGEAYFDVTHDPSRTFEVEAGRGRVRVLGTRFTVSSWGNLTQVFLEEGTVRFSGPSQSKAVVLQPGQSSTLGANQQQPVITDRPAGEFTDWMRDELVFQNRPAREVFSELEQQYGVTITAPDKILDTPLSGSLSLENREAALNYVALSLGGIFKQTGAQSYQFIPGDQ